MNTNQSSGYKTLQWKATNNQGQPVSAGVYLYSIYTGEVRDQEDGALKMIKYLTVLLIIGLEGEYLNKVNIN